MNRGYFLAVGLALFARGAIAQPRSAEIPIALSWRLIENLPTSRFRAELTIRNETSQPLAAGWALYFNSASRLYPNSVSTEFALEHINGDFWVLKPNPGSMPIAPAGSRAVALEGGPWAISQSDAPSGFYYVRQDQPERPPIALAVSIGPFPEAAKLKRGADDLVPVATAESRFRKNESLRLLPLKSLSRIVPTPLNEQPLTGQVRLNHATTVVFGEEQLAGTAELLLDYLQPLLDRRLLTRRGTAGGANTILLRIAGVEVEGLPRGTGSEAYSLTASRDNGIEIVGSDPAGVFYGVQSLRALLPVDAYRAPTAELSIDAVRIADAPRFRYRGLHLDVARNFQSKAAVERLLDLMAFYKLNRFHLHLTDDEGWRLEIRALPELTAVGSRRGHTLDESDRLVPSYGSGPFPDAPGSTGSGHYTQHDLVEILQYADQRQITVIPEIDMPGHSRAAIVAMQSRWRRMTDRGEPAADELLLRDPDDSSQYESVQMWNDNVVDVGRDATYRFLAIVVSELAGIYQRAGVPLATLHLGGDEVPAGAWEQSPACRQVALEADPNIPRRGQLELYFLNRASGVLAAHSIQPACWEDCLLLSTDISPTAAESRDGSTTSKPIAYVWNNVWGWGREDAAYRLANAGTDIVLCNATHLYFDLAYEKHPLELGYYWAGFVDTRAPFDLVPLDVFKNADKNGMGKSIGEESIANRVRLTAAGQQHVLGIQGQLWSENLRSQDALFYMAFPKLIALAERAWAKSPGWAEIDDPARFRNEQAQDWNQFANRLGQRELPRLDYLSGGVGYRIPAPGAIVQNGQVRANIDFPGLTLRYTIDGSEPTAKDAVFAEPLPATSTIGIRAFDSRGRGGPTATVGPAVP